MMLPVNDLMNPVHRSSYRKPGLIDPVVWKKDNHSLRKTLMNRYYT